MVLRVATLRLPKLSARRLSPRFAEENSHKNRLAGLPPSCGAVTAKAKKFARLSHEEARLEHSPRRRHIHHFISHVGRRRAGPVRSGVRFRPLCNHLANQLMVWGFWPFRASGRSSAVRPANLAVKAFLHFKGVLITSPALLRPRPPQCGRATLVAVWSLPINGVFVRYNKMGLPFYLSLSLSLSPSIPPLAGWVFGY